jgi:GTP pyrophosphokinase
MITVSKFIAKIKAYNPKADEALLQKAYIFSKSEHGNQKRHSGELYFSHPLAVAEILIDLKLDQDSIIAALLHDIVEDTDITLDEIRKKFGESVARLVDGVTKLGKIESIPVNERIAHNFRKLTLAMSQDIRVLLIKLADRLHNMRTLSYVPLKEKRVKKAQESLEIYAPLAARIGLNRIKDEMQDLAFQVIDKKNYDFIAEKLSKLITKKKDFINKAIEQLSEKFNEEKIKFEISGRQKTPYSIFKKIQVRNVGFNDVYDIMAFRIIVKDVAQCYRVLGVVNSSYNMIPGTFRDYISTPKENGYRSLHLAILGPLNKKIEIQIRDQRMHEEAELGLAAHWNYKEKNSKIKSKKETQQYQWIRDLLNLFENSPNTQDILAQTNLDMHKDEVFCFTPNGDIFNLLMGSTVIDFAYAVHSEIGNRCLSAKVNGMIAPLRQRLENGDQVEIITSKTAKPSSNWLQFVATPKAKYAIKAFIRGEKFKEHKKFGFGILNKYFVSKNLNFKEDLIEKTLPKFKLKNLDELYVKVAEGVIRRYEVAKAAYPEVKEEPNAEINFKKNSKSKDNSLPIDGLVSGMVVNFAGCCNPIPGDIIVGVINTGTGVTIHSQDCKNFKNLVLRPQRIIDVSWKDGDGSEKYLYPCKIKGILANKSGSLADITNIIAKKKVNILNLRISHRSADFFGIFVDIEVKNVAQIEEVLSELRASKKVLEFTRL